MLPTYRCCVSCEHIQPSMSFVIAAPAAASSGCFSTPNPKVFDVTIATPPIIQQGFESFKPPMGYYVQLNCSATGNPTPTVVWYRNGKLLKDGLVTNYAGQKLIINTYEERHRGIYQCFAQNVAGEAHVTGLLSFSSKKILERPKNVKCHPVNRTTILVTFQGHDNYKVSLLLLLWWWDPDEKLLSDDLLINIYIPICIQYVGAPDVIHSHVCGWFGSGIKFCIIQRIEPAESGRKK